MQRGGTGEGPTREEGEGGDGGVGVAFDHRRSRTLN